jgi:hypothetical protein
MPTFACVSHVFGNMNSSSAAVFIAFDGVIKSMTTVVEGRKSVLQGCITDYLGYRALARS